MAQAIGVQLSKARSDDLDDNVGRVEVEQAQIEEGSQTHWLPTTRGRMDPIIQFALSAENKNRNKNKDI